MNGRGVAVAVGCLAALLVVIPAAGDGGQSPGCSPSGARAPSLMAGAVRQRLYLPGLAAGDAPPEAPNDPPPSAELLGLEAALTDTVVAYGVAGQYTVAVTDLQTGQTIGVNPDRPQRAACLMNLFVIIETLRQVQAGTVPIETVDGLIRQTIWASDATTAQMLFGIIGEGDVLAGVRKVEQLLHDELELPEIILDHPPAYPEWSLGISGDNWATTRAMNAALGALYRGELLGPGWTDYLLEAMRIVKPGLNYLTANLPADAVVSHKNGFFWAEDGYVDNDTAIVRFESGGRWYAYAITFMSEQVGEKYADIWLGRDLVRMTWEYFRRVYGQG
ncbi:MAG: class A beta-lactamase-related serine hydrolase [Dehalococcoidia bacterium]|nr:class A beta-lactamase-related serine hydrolase [Dehalococcoidia bacterium]